MTTTVDDRYKRLYRHVEVGDGEAGLQTDWTGRLNRPPVSASGRLATGRQGMPPDKTMPPCYIIDPL